MIVIVFRPHGARAEDSKDQYLMMVPTQGTPVGLIKQVWTCDFRLAKIFHDPDLACKAYQRIRCASKSCGPCKGKCFHKTDETKIPPPPGSGSILVLRVSLTDALAAFVV